MLFFSGAKDADSKPDNLTFHLVTDDPNSDLGYLSLQQDLQDKTIKQFTQKDLELNRIFFTHKGT